MKLPDEADSAAREAAMKLIHRNVLDLMNFDPADPVNAPAIQPADLTPQTKGR